MTTDRKRQSWPPPPETQPSGPAGKSGVATKGQIWLGRLALLFSVAGAASSAGAIFFGQVPILVTLAHHGSFQPWYDHFIRVMEFLLFAGIVLLLAGAVLGLRSWRTTNGKVAVGLLLSPCLAFLAAWALWVWLAPIRHP